MPNFKSARGSDWHYEISGSGDAIIMIHGLGGTGRWWEAQKKFLAPDFQVVTLDLPGHGTSGWMPSNLFEMACDIRQLLASIGLSHFSVLASSMGGLVALELYRMAPDQIMRLSMVGSLPKFARGPGYPAGLDIEKIHTLSRQFDGNYAFILEMFFRSLFSMQERRKEDFHAVRQMYAQQPLPSREALKYFLDILEKADLRDRLSRLICPLQFITGTEDYICPKEIMDWMAGHLPHARFDFMEGCGHLPFLVETGEFNRLLEDFLLN